jgi:hypothetical protein
LLEGPAIGVAREPISAAGSIRPNGGRLLRSPIMETNAGLPAQRERPSCAASFDHLVGPREHGRR